MVIAAGGQRERVAIVTGGSRGMGRETVERLASLGYAVVVNYVHDQRTAESTVESVLEGRGAAVAIRADVTDVLDVDRLFAQTIETFGAVDAVVHAVRGHVAASSLTDLALDDFDEMCRTSLRATFIVNRMAASLLSNGGAIVNLFSSVAASALPAYAGYATTAAAVGTLTRVLALELRERDITVNGVSLEVDKPCAPSRAAEMVTYLLGDDGHGITGHVIHLDDEPCSGHWTGPERVTRIRRPRTSSASASERRAGHDGSSEIESISPAISCSASHVCRPAHECGLDPALHRDGAHAPPKRDRSRDGTPRQAGGRSRRHLPSRRRVRQPAIRRASAPAVDVADRMRRPHPDSVS
jgi:3-oxoacyl-[acyl-carrier protein] reductase